MELNKEAENKIAKLQMMEQNLQSINLQKQTFQSQLLEIENALNELDNVKEAYKIVGQIMIASKKEDLKKDLDQKKEILDLRVKSLDKQEKDLKDRASNLQSEILKSLNKSKDRS
jgi:prefoldin beta subunit